MKKTISIIIATVLMLSLSVCVFANGNSTIVSLTLDTSLESYTLSIPAEVTFDVATRKATLNYEISDVNYVWSDLLYTSVSSENFDATGSNLVKTDDATKKIHYILRNSDGSNLDSKHGALWCFCRDGSESDPEGFDHIDLEIDGDYIESGTYTDTLTFSVEMVIKTW